MAAALYMEALADIPPELLDKAVKHCIRTCRFFPKPAELRGAIADELAERCRRQNERRYAALPPPVDPPSAEDIAYVDELLAPMKAGIRERAKTIRDLPPLPREPLPPFHLLDEDDPRVAEIMGRGMMAEEERSDVL